MRKPFETWAVIYTFEHGEESFVEEARSLENAQQKALKNGPNTRVAKLFELSENEAAFIKQQRGAEAVFVGGSGIQERDISAKPGIPPKLYHKTCEYTGSPIDARRPDAANLETVDSDREKWRREFSAELLKQGIPLTEGYRCGLSDELKNTFPMEALVVECVNWTDLLLEVLEQPKKDVK